MTHASWNNERGRPSGPGHDNERLEYLGDAVLELVVGEYLFKRFPEYDEGQLTQLRAALVNTLTLARLAERLDLGGALFVGKGAAKTGARKLPSLLANAFEAMIGAIFLDQGYRVATRVFLQNIGDLAEWSDENFKGKLQEVAQDRTGTTPTYHVVASGGPGHKREYTADAIVGGDVVGTGRGGTKQAAEQSAARAALQTLTRQPRRRAPRTAAARAAGAARDATRGVAAEPARVRRRVAEVAADRSVAARERPQRPAATPTAAEPPSPAPLTAPQRRRGLLAALRSAAEALVGRVVPPEPAAGERPPRRELPRGAASVPWPPPPGAAGREGAAAGRGRARGSQAGKKSPAAGPAASGRTADSAGRASTARGGSRGGGAAGPAPRGEAGRSQRSATGGRAAAQGDRAAGRARSGKAAADGVATGATAAPGTGPRTRGGATVAQGSRPPRARRAAATTTEPGTPAVAAGDASTEARRPTRRGRRGGRGRRRPGTAGGADELSQP